MATRTVGDYEIFADSSNVPRSATSRSLLFGNDCKSVEIELLGLSPWRAGAFDRKDLCRSRSFTQVVSWGRV
jgi:hypothetical protein